jgi:hypothetical protein
VQPRALVNLSDFLNAPSAYPRGPFQNQMIRIGKHRDVELWSRWFMLPCALGLLTLEWVLRRRFGYI